MDIIYTAFKRLYPGKEFNYTYTLEFSRRFKSYNAHVRYTKNSIAFNLSKDWETASDEITIGLIQSLMLKIFKEKRSTTNIDLYNLFIKKLHISIPKIKTHPTLEESYDRVNNEYFYGLVEKPNLIWGRDSIRKLGSYDFQTDTISISSIFKEHSNLLDYIMYHELLHKKHKFTNKNNQSRYHTSSFKKKEAEFKDQKNIEREIKRLTSKIRRKSSFLDFKGWF